MKIKCMHGFFVFEETVIGQVSDFISYTGLMLSSWEDYFTFDFLVPPPEYSIKGKPFLGFTSIKTFEGRPWEVFEANGVVYDWSAGIIKPITSITTVTNIRAAGNRYLANGLLLPGCLNQNGDRVESFSGFFAKDTKRFTYSEVTYV